MCGFKHSDALKEKCSVSMEECVLQGIKNGKLNYMTGRVSGLYSDIASEAADMIEEFVMKEKMTEAIRRRALKSPLAQNYAIWYFHDYITLDKAENLEYYKNLFFKRKNLRKIDYEFLRTFIVDKRDKLYEVFRELIDKFEKIKNLSETERIQDEMPF